MPRDMFGNVVKPSIAIGNRKWYSVPVSLFSHAMIVLALVAIPILVPSAMPMPKITTIFSATPPTPPEPPRPPQPRDDHPKAPPEVTPSFPTTPPDTIGREVERAPVIDDRPIDVIVGTVTTGLPEAPPKVDKAPDRPLPVGGLIRPPRKLAGQQPVYPSIAQSARVQGIVIIEATIGEDGHVMNAKILRSIPLLDSAALDAVRTWSYSPTLLNGIPVAVIMTVTVQFSLQ